MAKAKFFDIGNVLRTLKATVVGIIAGLVPLFLMALSRLAEGTTAIKIAGALTLLYLPIYFFLWGYLARSWWGWK